MNKWIMLAIMVLISAAVAFAQVPSPSTPMILLPDGSYWDGTSAVTIGSISVSVGAPPDANLVTSVSVTAVATTTASLANRKSASVFNTSGTITLWVSFDSAVASATVNTSIPVWPYSFVSTELDAAKIIGLVASEAMTATVYQDGY
jgi:hypothetical protein